MWNIINLIRIFLGIVRDYYSPVSRIAAIHGSFNASCTDSRPYKAMSETNTYIVL